MIVLESLADLSLPDLQIEGIHEVREHVERSLTESMRNGTPTAQDLFILNYRFYALLSLFADIKINVGTDADGHFLEVIGELTQETPSWN